MLQARLAHGHHCRCKVVAERKPRATSREEESSAAETRQARLHARYGDDWLHELFTAHPRPSQTHDVFWIFAHNDAADCAPIAGKWLVLRM